MADAVEHLREEVDLAAALLPQHMLNVGMEALTGKNQQVLRSVVGGVAVEMMDDLTGKQWATQQCGGRA